MSQATWAPDTELYNPLAGKSQPAGGRPGRAAATVPGYERVMGQLRDRALEQFTAAQLAEAQPETVAWLAQCADELVKAEKDRLFPQWRAGFHAASRVGGAGFAQRCVGHGAD